LRSSAMGGVTGGSMRYPGKNPLLGVRGI